MVSLTVVSRFQKSPFSRVLNYCLMEIGNIVEVMLSQWVVFFRRALTLRLLNVRI